ncbi:MAG: site-2 protease family protein [archaeon]
MNYDLIFAIIFYGLIYIYYLKHKDKFQIQGKIFALYKTKLGLKLMDKLSKVSPKLLRFIGKIGILIGFVGMFLIFYLLISGTIKLIFVPKAPPTVAPVLPGVSIPGLPILSFWHWIIAILIVAIIHEFSHGLFARLYNVKIKSSGFAFLGPILAAFVEPDEKVLNKRNKKQQLSIFAAGPFANIILAFLILLITQFIFYPINSSLTENNGLLIAAIEPNMPANMSNIEPGTIITGINDQRTFTTDSFISEISKTKEGSSITVNTNKGDYEVIPVFIEGKPKLGVSLTESKDYKKNVPKFIQSSLVWIFELLFWLWVISLGIGLFNLLPLGPVDGGRMFLAGLMIFTNKEKAHKIWKIVSIFCLLLIIINLLPYLFKLVSWLFNLIISIL